MKLFVLLKNKISYEKKRIQKIANVKKTEKCSAWINTASIDETLEVLLKTSCSMCRYGDGEYKVMAGKGNGFQKEDPVLGSRLKQILKTNIADLLVCIPNISDDMKLRTEDARQFWQGCIEEWGGSFAKQLLPEKKYYNAHVTRLYMDYQNSEKCGIWFDKIKQVWSGKRLLIVEGEKTRLGIGNDLLADAKSVERVICPSKSAFSIYDEILETVTSVYDGQLVLIALGQTATVLAYDLHCKGIRALDIGHIDIEYEWFLSKAKEKTAVAGKYVKEVDDQIDSVVNPVYSKQIVKKVGV